ncbi:hypothetical protein [Pyrobaculum aerophilum]|uniref:Uncharacterized protein n=1 Tax=Pyrobaculum aerophilum TaxID=13773 RepID=A0A832STY4_9CREN|nr:MULTISPECIES: hypothetical protein [Pyrobaculum]HII47843.1 hypothetical protein [Pyrobaculum aerophilum]
MARVRWQVVHVYEASGQVRPWVSRMKSGGRVVMYSAWPHIEFVEFTPSGPVVRPCKARPPGRGGYHGHRGPLGLSRATGAWLLACGGSLACGWRAFGHWRADPPPRGDCPLPVGDEDQEAAESHWPEPPRQPGGEGPLADTAARLVPQKALEIGLHAVGRLPILSKR